MRAFKFNPTPGTPGKFEPGDVIRVVQGESLAWVKRVPLVVLGYQFNEAPHVLTIDGGDPTTSDTWINHVLDEDCVLDVFLTAARKAIAQ